MSDYDVHCDPCGAADVRTRWCDRCGIDYCEDCEEFHAAVHEEVVAEQDRVARWY